VAGGPVLVGPRVVTLETWGGSRLTQS